MTVPEPDVDFAAAVLQRRAGLQIQDSIRGRLARCLAEACAESGLDPHDSARRLDSDTATLQRLLNLVTVQETSFFRDQAQFDALAGLLPSFGSPTTIWSAACSNGQEAYSLAMLLDQAGDTASTVVASDISTDALERTRAGRYTDREISGLSTEQQRRYLRPTADGMFQVADELRDRVETVRVNLAGDAPPFPVGSCPVFFCRNVLIYFDQPQIVRLLEQFSRWLPPHGVLFLGYSEALWQTTSRFELDRIGPAFLYRPRHDARPVKGTSAPRGRRSQRESTSRAPQRRRTDRSGETPAAARRQRNKVAPAAKPEPSPEVLFESGLDSMRAGKLEAAVDEFRKCVYLDPEWVLAHAHLAFALEATGDLVAARRAFAAARSSLDRAVPGSLESDLGGFDSEELARLLDNKMRQDIMPKDTLEESR